jgi:predicted peroxiredoxin
VHRCDQALTVARAARDQGRDVVLFLNVDAPRLADAGTPLMAGLAGKPSLRAQLAALIEQGVEVVVARGCAAVCDVDLDALVDGARPGTAGEIAGMIAGGAGVISY